MLSSNLYPSPAGPRFYAREASADSGARGNVRAVTGDSTGALLEPRLVGDIQDAFFVPAYQRGYRWGAAEVGRLLDDVHESRGEPYFLQPVVVKARQDGRWELIDGQQRLTTLYLILKYMHDQGLQSTGPSFSLEYETRPSSRTYLESPDEARSQENIDFFHIWEAYQCIDRWFEQFAHRRQNVANHLYGYFFDAVRVIWYEAPADLDSIALFTRLNIGRIPLTDAELVKALLLSRSGSARERTDRSHEIAAQWDVVERDLRAPEVWAFATGMAAQQPTHISLLLDTLADLESDVGTGRQRPLFHTFETLRPNIEASPEDVWTRIVDLHALVLGWYNNRDLFHKIGYLIATGRHSFRELVLLAQGQAKSSFERMLDQRIRGDLDLSPADLGELTYEGQKTSSALLLMNVETVRRLQHSSERFSFRAYASGSWSLEHIHAQNAERLNRAEQWQEWLRLHREALAGLAELDAAERTQLEERIAAALEDISEEKFRPLERELTQRFTQAGDSDNDEVDSIANLALLASGDNSALSNSVFEVKRRQILRLDRQGSYIPISTRNVFLKYYTDAEGQQIHFWGRHDREGYLDALREVLEPYLLHEEVLV
jgi:hypothetical protein